MPVGAVGAARMAATDMTRLTVAASVPILIGLVLLLAICGGALYLARLNQTQNAVALLDTQISFAANGLRGELLNAESSQRGFLLTHRALYRAPYTASVHAVLDDEQRLLSRIVSHPELAALVARVREDVQRKLAEMQHTLALYDAGQADAAIATVQTDEGLKLTQSILADLATLRRSVADEREAATARQNASFTLLVATIGLAGLGALLMAALAMLQVRHHLRKLRRREYQLDQLVTSLEARVASRTQALAEANQRFQIALDSSDITVFSQDRDLVYVWISRGLPDRTVEEIVGKTDAELLPAAAGSLDRLKRNVLATGEPERQEIRVDFASGTRHYLITVVPTRDAAGEIEGVVGGAVDISESKRHEAHVRLLLREVTHRSKNLLAVIQAIMRQTATHAPSTADFTKRFSARLDGLAGSLDLLVQEDWRGVTLADLVRSQLAHHVDADFSQIEMEGPEVSLPPDAAQNIGMALHELATNAAKYGALSIPPGRVRVSWETREAADGTICALKWEERNGPPVAPPPRRGFGQVVIERTVARAVGGTVTLTYPSSGLVWLLEFPVRNEQPD
ncbi:MAG TPA: HWE histidine kinase domain-containing protein [Acetobacteraceae bacterium]|nr:HWE histidine kinase domain-containing protein [Acetobacteraceae bacterium]